MTGDSQILYGGMSGLTESSLLNIKNKSFAVTAKLAIPADGASGVVISQGGEHAGWAIYLLEGVPHYTHNFLGLNEYTVSGKKAIPEGTHQLRVEFDYDGGGVSKGGTATLFVDGDRAGQGRVEQTVGIMFASDETTDIGRDTATVSPTPTGRAARTTSPATSAGSGSTSETMPTIPTTTSTKATASRRSSDDNDPSVPRSERRLRPRRPRRRSHGRTSLG